MRFHVGLVLALSLITSACLGTGAATPSHSAGSSTTAGSGAVSRGSGVGAAVVLGEGHTRGSFVAHYPFGGATITISAHAPAGTRLRVYINDPMYGRPGPSFPGTTLTNSNGCHRRAARLICSAGPFEAFEPGVVSKSWTVWIVKRSRPAATVHASITFTRGRT
jgi:hypothetical protein